VIKKITQCVVLCSVIMSGLTFAANKEEDSDLWKYQTEYLNNMKLSLSKIQSLNENLEKCRNIYYEKKSIEDKNNYLKATKDYSTSLAISTVMLSQSIPALEDKMINDKEMVLTNLRDYKESLPELVLSEKKRNEDLVENYRNTFKEVNAVFCPKYKYIINYVLMDN